MDKGGVTRRDWLLLGAAATAGAFLDGTEGHEREARADPEVSGWSFDVDIAGITKEPIPGYALSMGSLSFAIKAHGNGGNAQLAVEDAFMSDVALTFACSAASDAIAAWFDEAMAGKDMRKDITITLHQQQGAVGARTCVLRGSRPVRHSTAQLETTARPPRETIRVKVGRIEFKT